MTYVMQAASSVDGQLYAWTSTTADYAGDGYPGDGDPTNVVVLAAVDGSGAEATDNATVEQLATELDTTDDTPTTIGATFALPSDSISTVDAQVSCVQAGAGKAKVFNVRRHLLNDGGSVTASTQADMTGPDEIGGSLAATVAIAYTGTTGRIEVTGVAGVGLRWRIDRQVAKVAAAAGAAAPTVTSISPTNGDELTAVPLTITGTGFVSGCTVTVGGVAATSVVFGSSTSLTCTTSALLAAGAHHVVVTNPDAQTGTLSNGYTANAPAVVDPATYDLSAFWQSAFASSPWTDTASAGTSGGRTLSEATNPPAATSLGGIACASFDGTNDKLATSAVESDLFTASAGSGAILYYALAADLAADAGLLGDAGLLCGAGGYFTAGINATGPRIGLYDTGYKSIQLTGGVSGWAVLQWKWDGTDLKARLNSDAWSTLSCGDMGDLTSAFNVGANYDASAFGKLGVRRILTGKTTWSDARFDEIIAEVNDTFGLAL